MKTEVKVPEVGESIQEVQVGQWLKKEGERVELDENIVELETDKASLELPAPVSGRLSRIVKQAHDVVAVGETIAYIEPVSADSASAEDPQSPNQASGNEKPPESKAKSSRAEVQVEPSEKIPVTPSGRRALREHGLTPDQIQPRGDRIRQFDVERHVARQTGSDEAGDSPEQEETPAAVQEQNDPKGSQAAKNRDRRTDEQRAKNSPEQETGKQKSSQQESPQPKSRHEDAEIEEPDQEARSEDSGSESQEPGSASQELREENGRAADASSLELDFGQEELVPMSLIRRRIAARLVKAQRDAALLTTFNQVDMTEVMQLRRKYQESFQRRYQVRLGFMSFFVKAVVDALKQCPALNAEIRGEDILYRNYYHVGIAIGGERGLVVPVLRHAERLSFAEIEQAIAGYIRRVNENQITPDELQGGTFTISNGGIYGSLLSTPIVNPPQSGVLGMHAIEERPVARDGQVVIRPMMYVALTYDHRIVDGAEAVTCLRRIKEAIEEPARMLVEV